MHMNAYVERVIESVRQKHGNEPEFVQTVEEVLSSLSPVIDKHPEYEKADLLGRIVEPERTVKTLCFLQTMDDFAAFNEVYARYFTEKPARSCVAVRTLPKGVLVEVEAIAEL